MRKEERKSMDDSLIKMALSGVDTVAMSARGMGKPSVIGTRLKKLGFEWIPTYGDRAGHWQESTAYVDIPDGISIIIPRKTKVKFKGAKGHEMEGFIMPVTSVNEFCTSMDGLTNAPNVNAESFMMAHGVLDFLDLNKNSKNDDGWINVVIRKQDNSLGQFAGRNAILCWITK